MAEIPVLEQDGLRLTQTAPILLRLAEKYGRFGGENPTEQFELLRWLFWDNHKLTGYMATYRYQRTFTPSPDPRVLSYFRKRIDDFLTKASPAGKSAYDLLPGKRLKQYA